MAERKNPEARGDAQANAPAVELDDESLDQASGGAASTTTPKYSKDASHPGEIDLNS